MSANEESKPAEVVATALKMEPCGPLIRMIFFNAGVVVGRVLLPADTRVRPIESARRDH